MAIEWSSALATGVAWQDSQHKELFRRINRLLDAVSVGLGKEEVAKLFTFLDVYFVEHFEAEERAMHRLDYPGTLAHVEAHTKFIDLMGGLRKDFGKGPSSALVIRVQREVVDWLINHIGGIDKALGAFIKKAGESV